MNLRRSVAVAAFVLAVPVVSSCGVGFNEQTDQVYNPAAGVDDRSGSVNVLNALVVSGSNGSGTVIASLVNEDQSQPDKLVSVAGAGRDSSLQVTPGGSTEIPAGGVLNLATDGQVFVRGSRVVPGSLVNLTFTFQRGKAVTLNTPVVSSSDPTYAGVKLPS